MTRDERKTYNLIKKQRDAQHRKLIKTTQEWEKQRELTLLLDGFEDDNS
jgi:hypothetical protein